MSWSVYVIGEAETDGPVKIGYAQSIKQRVNALQTGNPRRLTIIYSAAAGDCSRAAAMERALHQKCRAFRIRGEWFSADAVRVAVDYLKTPESWPAARKRGGTTSHDRERACLAILSNPALREKYPSDDAIAKRIGAAPVLVEVTREIWELSGCKQAAA